MKTFITDAIECPWCKFEITRQTGEGVPREGDVTICINCLNLNVFQKEGTLRKMTEQEYKQIHPDNLQRIHLYQAMLKSIKNDKNRAPGTL